MKEVVSIQSVVFLFALCIFSCSALLPLFAMYSWHDHQRIAEVFLICVVCFLSFFCFRVPFFSSFWCVYIFFIIGYISSFFSVDFGWALREWSRWFGLFMVVIFGGSLYTSQVFSQYSSPATGISAIMIPASRAEKYFGALFINLCFSVPFVLLFMKLHWNHRYHI